MKRICLSSDNEKTAIGVTAAVIIALIVDMELSNIADIPVPVLPPGWEYLYL